MGSETVYTERLFISKNHRQLRYPIPLPISNTVVLDGGERERETERERERQRETERDRTISNSDAGQACGVNSLSRLFDGVGP